MIGYLDCFSGLSGDMLLGALVVTGSGSDDQARRVDVAVVP